MKRELKIVLGRVLEALTEHPQSIKTISKKSVVSWETTKNCLETLQYLDFIDVSLKLKRPRYMLKPSIKEVRTTELYTYLEKEGWSLTPYNENFKTAKKKFDDGVFEMLIPNNELVKDYDSRIRSIYKNLAILNDKNVLNIIQEIKDCEK